MTSAVPCGGEAPSPRTLAETFIDAGDAHAALAVCAAWRARDPDDAEISAVEAAARQAGAAQGPAPSLDGALAERLARHGYLGEALVVLDRVAGADEHLRRRAALLRDVLAYSLPPGAPRIQASAEAQVTQRRLRVAVAMYRELCNERPDADEPRARLARLEELLRWVGPAADRPVRVAHALSDAVERPAPPPPPGRRRLPIHTDLSLEVPRAVREDGATRASAVEWIDPLDDTQRLDREPLGLARARRNPALARTQPSASPMLSADEAGRSVVALPDEVTSVLERNPARSPVAEAAEHAEPLGVIVRPVLVLN
jgi:hypothetical protein